LARADFVAICEGRVFYASTVEEGPVAAVSIFKKRALGAAFDGEVQAGHERVMG